MTVSTAPRELLEQLLDDPATGFSVGCFGAIAEFSRAPGEPSAALAPLGRATERGSVRVELSEDATLFAWEAPRGHGAPWMQGLELLLDEASARMGGRTELTRVEDTADGALFDLGLGAPNVDACVLADEALARELDPCCGRSVLDPDNPAMEAIKHASPSRVFRSAVAEVRVHQRIGSTRRGIPTPHGPHTHVLPALLAKGLAGPENVRLPEGRLPVLGIHPPHPLRDALGDAKAFDRAEHESFQERLAELGDPTYVAAKRALLAWVLGEGPEPTELDKRVPRVLLHQLPHQGVAPERVREVAEHWGLAHVAPDA